MKNIIAISVLSFISLTVIVTVFFALFSLRPELFGVEPIAEKSQAETKEEAIEAEQTKKDSVSKIVTPLQPNKNEAAKSYNSVVVAKKETPAKKAAASLQPQPAADTTDWKEKAKIFDAMTVDDASKILRKMKDKDIKKIISYIKKRNAAKILATFEPERAARILR